MLSLLISYFQPQSNFILKLIAQNNSLAYIFAFNLYTYRTTVAYIKVSGIVRFVVNPVKLILLGKNFSNMAQLIGKFNLVFFILQNETQKVADKLENPFPCDI